MTRYTNMGRKRSYVEAGFSDTFHDESESEPAHQIPEDIPGPVAGPSTGPPPDSDTSKTVTKKRKRSRNKKKKSDKGEEHDEGGVGDDTNTNAERKEVDETVKSAYGRANREKLRKNSSIRAEQAEWRRQKRIDERLAGTTCFACREKGHAAKDCPTIKPDSKAKGSKHEKTAVGICYRCGSDRHTLSRCRVPSNSDNPLPYASCFVCSGRGHLASSCPKNAGKGIYPKGGCCKLCSETSHLARDCPLRKPDTSQPTIIIGTTTNNNRTTNKNNAQDQAGADEDDFHILKRLNAEVDAEERSLARKVAKSRKEGVGAVGAVTHKPFRSTQLLPPPQEVATKKQPKVVNF